MPANFLTNNTCFPLASRKHVLFLIELYSEDVRKKRSEVGEEHGFRLQGKYVQKWSLTHPTHTL